MIPCSRRLAGPLALAGALGALFCAGSARAQVLVTPTVASMGSVFNYSYSITNLGMADLAVINLNGLALDPATATNLMAPAGYQITFDPNLGIASFLPGLDNASTFGAGSVVSGFSFDSAFAPSAVAFDTLDANGAATTGTTLGPAAVPEASTLVSLGAGLSVLALIAVRRRRSASSAS